MKRFLPFAALLLLWLVPLAWAQVYDPTSGQQKVIVSSGTPSATSPCSVTIPINQTASTDVHTFTAKGHICTVMLISAGAQGISLSEGTGSVCAGGTAYLMGGSGGTVAVAANGGFSMVAEAPWINLGTTGDHLCVLQSASSNVSGTITASDN